MTKVLFYRSCPKLTHICLFVFLIVCLQKLYSLSHESGKSAAKFFVNSFPKFFTKDFAEPHVPVRNLNLKMAFSEGKSFPGCDYVSFKGIAALKLISV